MKIAFYIEEGIKQLVLTPESDYEKDMLKVLDEPAELTVTHGEFFLNLAGYIRYQGPRYDVFNDKETGRSTILVLNKPTKEKE